MKALQCSGLAIALLATPSTGMAQKSEPQKKLYCWDEGGRRVCGDALPASALDKARTEVSSRSGLAGNRIDRALTEQERQALAERQAVAAADAEVLAAEHRRDLALAESYDSEQALRDAFKIRYEITDEGLKTTRMGIDNQRRVLLQLLNAAANAELKGGNVPAKLARNVQTQRIAVVDASRAHRILEEERSALDTQLAEAIARYRKAKGIASPDEAAPASPATPSSTTAPAG